MQDRYAGDIGDLGKYGLLRVLCGHDLKWGVNWYLTPNDGLSGNGRVIDYLRDTPQNRKLFAACDLDLYEKLRGIVFPQAGDEKTLKQADEERKACPHFECPGKDEVTSCLNRRCVFKVERRAVLPEKTKFYSRILDFSHLSSMSKKENFRKRWVEDGFNILGDCSVVFFDPDNGLEARSISKTHKNGNKYVYADEIKPFYECGQSLVIYQHRTREAEEEYLKRIQSLIEEATGRGELKMFIMRYHPRSVRDFIIVPHHRSSHGKIFEYRLKDMLESNWQQHFSKRELP